MILSQGRHIATLGHVNLPIVTNRLSNFSLFVFVDNAQYRMKMLDKMIDIAKVMVVNPSPSHFVCIVNPLHLGFMIVPGKI